MYRSLVFFLAVLLGMFVLGLAPRGASAGPLPAISGLDLNLPTAEKVQYSRRYYRRMMRRGYVPGAVVVTPPAVVAPGPVIVPLRPTSCGQYHYWNGVACVDARYNDPDLGPRP